MPLAKVIFRVLIAVILAFHSALTFVRRIDCIVCEQRNSETGSRYRSLQDLALTDTDLKKYSGGLT